MENNKPSILNMKFTIKTQASGMGQFSSLKF
jgi:hypothetical protein